MVICRLHLSYHLRVKASEYLLGGNFFEQYLVSVQQRAVDGSEVELSHVVHMKIDVTLNKGCLYMSVSRLRSNLWEASMLTMRDQDKSPLEVNIFEIKVTLTSSYITDRAFIASYPQPFQNTKFGI